MPVFDIARKYGVSEGYVRLLMHNNGAARTNGKRQRNLRCARYRLAGQVVADYKTGAYTHTDIAEKYGVSTRTISRILDDAGIEANPAARAVSALDAADVLEGVRADLEGGLDCYTIAKRRSIPMRAVEKIREGRYDSLCVTRSGDAELEVSRLHSQGLAPPEIAEKAGLSAPTVRKILGKMGLQPNKPSDKRRPAVIELCRQGLGVDMIADRTGLSATTVRRILGKMGLQPNGRSERPCASEGYGDVRGKVAEGWDRGLGVADISLHLFWEL